MGMNIDPQMLAMLQQLMAQKKMGPQPLSMAPDMSIFGPKTGPIANPVQAAAPMSMMDKALPFLGLGSGVLQGIGGMIEGNKQRKQAGKQRDLQRQGMSIQQGQGNVDGFQRLMQLLLASSQRGGM